MKLFIKKCIIVGSFLLAGTVFAEEGLGNIGVPVSNLFFDALIEPIILAKCGSGICHNGEVGAATDYRTYDLLKPIIIDSDLFEDRVFIRKDMPKPGFELTPEEREALLQKRVSAEQSETDSTSGVHGHEKEEG